jgi:hypothetical protein
LTLEVLAEVHFLGVGSLQQVKGLCSVKLVAQWSEVLAWAFFLA